MGEGGREGEREREIEIEIERERERERLRILSRFHAQHGAQHGAQSHHREIMTSAEIKGQILNQLSHLGDPKLKYNLNIHN